MTPLLLLALLAGPAGAAASEPAGEPARVGVLAGGGAELGGDGMGTHLGFAAGLTLELPLSKVLGLALRPGYYEKGVGSRGYGYLGIPMLIRYPANRGAFVIGGVETNFPLGHDSGVDVALTVGSGFDFGRGRTRGFLEWRFALSVSGGDSGSVDVVHAPMPPGGPVLSGYQASGARYQTLTLVMGVTRAVGRKTDR